MGGSVNVAIRLSNGDTTCNEHWTNPISYWLKRPALYASDQGAREYLAEYAALHATDGYGHPKPLSNAEYGLVVIDYVTKTILSNNGYTELDSFHPVEAVHERTPSAFQECAEAGLLRLQTTKYKRAKPEWEKIEDTESSNLPAETAMKIAMEVWEKESRPSLRALLGTVTMSRFLIDTAPFTIEIFPEGETKAMRARLREIGFPMTREAGLNA